MLTLHIIAEQSISPRDDAFLLGREADHTAGVDADGHARALPANAMPRPTRRPRLITQEEVAPSCDTRAAGASSPPPYSQPLTLLL